MEHITKAYNWVMEIPDADRLNLVSAIMLVNGLFSFLALLVVRAPYGRYSSSASKTWGFKVPARLAWIIMESPSSIIFIICWFYAFTVEKTLNVHYLSNHILAALFLLHYIQRAFIYPFRTRQGAPMPVSIMFMAWFFCLSNGYLQGRTVANYLGPQLWETEAVISRGVYQWPHSPAAQTDLIRFSVGVFLFLLGFSINVHSDHILINLRGPNEKGYKIPKGGMFRFVSCANYFGEIVEWAGWAVACWGGPVSTLDPFHGWIWPGLSFCIFTFCNLAPRAWAHHKNYLEKFREDYPKTRRAIIPFIW